MTGITGGAGIRIAVYSLVIVIRARVGMANRATENRIVARCCMTFGALVPFAFVLPAVNREIHIIVIKSCGCPGRFRVAILASCRETHGSVIRAVRLIVICLVATDTSVWRIAVIAVCMAGITGKRFVCAV